MSGLPGLFITGTDTGVGKTWLTRRIVEALRSDGTRVGVLKPVATGAEFGPDGAPTWSDAIELAASVGGEVPRERIVPILFEAPLAPPVAARLLGLSLTARSVLESTRAAIQWWQSERMAEVVVVEGVGGLLCPLADDMLVADLAVELDFPLVILGRRGLGTLNHTLLTLEAAQRRGLRIAGVVLNAADHATEPLAEQTNPAELSRWLPDGVPLLANVPNLAGEGLPHALIGINWRARCFPSRCLATPS